MSTGFRESDYEEEEDFIVNNESESASSSVVSSRRSTIAPSHEPQFTSQPHEQLQPQSQQQNVGLSAKELKVKLIQVVRNKGILDSMKVKLNGNKLM